MRSTIACLGVAACALAPYWPTAVAWWRGGLYVGTGNGHVYRSVPE
jgi:hypothetical protein